MKSEYENPMAKSSANQVIGKIVWVDKQKKRAVVQLAASYIRTYTNELTSIAKDQTTSALLKPTEIRNKKSLGTVIVYGEPNVGDSVIVNAKARKSTNTSKLATQKPLEKKQTAVTKTQKMQTDSNTEKVAPKKAPPKIRYSDIETSVKVINN